MRVAGIAGEEDAVVFVEVVDEALADGVCGPPEGAGDFEGVGLEDLLRGAVEIFELDGFGDGAVWELDVAANELVTFPWY
jgi:hypothetical protein